MKNFFDVLRGLPDIIRVVKAIEESFPIPTVGKQKLEVLLDMLAAIFGDITPVLGVVSGLVSKIVAFAKAVGAFKSASVKP